MFATILATILDTKARKKSYIVGKDYPYNRAKQLMDHNEVKKLAFKQFHCCGLGVRDTHETSSNLRGR